MKVITIREPFASLIATSKKKIETRSWKTNYRGKIYIHAGLSKVTKEYDISNISYLLQDLKYSYGYIICEAELIDCIYMTKEYIEDLKSNNYQEYLVGKYEEGRYAWILDNIKPLENKIEVKGKLGIWNYEK
ncbi:MAG: ASCH domain-containing protein [Bacilli bacterium]|nr:ASCH domain-containing protein [Bacilli bacterium]